MKLCLLLCLSFVPWSHGRGWSSTQKLTPQAQPQMQDVTKQCENMERIRAAHDRERMQIPRGDKFDDFDWHLSKELNTVERGNIVISPISLKVVLAMLYEGARGKTAQEIGDALDIHNSTLEQRRHSRERFSTILQSLQTSEGEHKIKMGTHAFIEQTADVSQIYQCKLKTYYNSDIVKVDFRNPSAAIKVINNWAKNVTEGHIQDLISESEAQSSTIMLLLNAVYFKGQWEVPFPVNQTKPGTFHLDNQKTVTVPFMNVTEKFGYYDLPDIGAHMVELPYKGNKFSMFVLLPYNNTDLDALAKKLGPERSLSGIISHMMPTTINLIMPKFEYDFTTKLRSTLERLGIKTMFSGDAELTDIARTKSGGLVVSNVLQKAGISVTEAGTVAYAATAIDLVDKFGGSEETVDFIVDRPFLFFIEDITIRTTVFVGKVTNPDTAKVISTPQEAPAEKPTGGSESDVLADRLGQNGQQNNNQWNRKPTNQPQPGPREQTSQSRFNFFDGELLQAVGRDQRGNFVISPASVKTLLGLILEGADGVTLNEVKEMLRLPNDTVQARQLMGSLQGVLKKMNTSQVEVDSETHSFLSQDFTFNTTYVKVVQDLYKAGLTSVDFKTPENAANRINSWVRSKTRGKIDNLVDSDKIDPDTMAILVNTIYFNGKWLNEFEQKDTTEDCFYSEPNLACNKVQIMFKKDMLNYKFDKDYNSHIVQLPYKDERFSMVLVVPAAKDGARKIVRDINRLTFPALLDRATVHEVHLKLPRFTAEYESDLTQTLTKMGLNSVFSSDANLPFMINGNQVRIAKVVHKAKIDVNEKGTKAAAASGASVVPLMSGNESAFVTADHPFYYFIYETESRSVLFSGRISSLNGELVTDDNIVDGGATPLSSNSNYGKPSYAQVANNNPAGGTQPQNHPSRQPSPPDESKKTPNMPSNSEVQYLGSNNQPYNVRIPTKPPQPQSSPQPGPDFQYPADHGQQLTGSQFFEDYKKRHQNNFRSLRRGA